MAKITNSLKNQGTVSQKILQVNPYSESIMKITVTALTLPNLRAFPKPEQVRLKFSRIVFRFPYDDTELLTSITSTMADMNAEAVNMTHLPRRALCNAQLTPADKCDDGDLDIITGFTVIDTEYRLIVLEGLADGKALETLYSKIPKRHKILFNQHVSFRHRLYGSFELELKTIKLNSLLSKILSDANMYTRSHIPIDCYDALRCLFGLCEALNLQNAKLQNFCATDYQLLALERRFGGFVSDEDIEGLPMNTKRMKEIQVASSKVFINLCLILN